MTPRNKAGPFQPFTVAVTKDDELLAVMLKLEVESDNVVSEAR
ncbi:hypothetical protein [Agrobacterium tumefaciens]|nr:hypothetical protein [Agrobacterium tumefaciens]